MGEVRNRLFSGQDPYADYTPIPFNGHGWASEDPAFEEYINLVKPKLIIEVGTWFGGSSRSIVAACLKVGIEDFEVVCIDTFLGSVEHWNKSSYLMTFKNGRPTIYDQFISNTIHSGYQNYVTPFPVDSENGYLTLKGFGVVPDFVYIDAGHDYNSVRNDLINWSNLVRPGGVIMGDDWHHPPIKQAVYDVFTKEAVIERGAKFAWIK